MLKSVKKDFLPKATKDVRTNMIALFVSQEQNVTNLICGPTRNRMYVTREIENNDYEFIHLFRSGTGGGRGKQMWAVVNKKLMHSMFYMLKFPR